jgi:predicted permease
MKWWPPFSGKRKIETELDSELRYHLEQQIEANIASGMSPEDARRNAAIEFGGLDQIKEECRDQRALVRLELLLKDIQFSIRSVLRSLGFFLTTIGTLALGVGIATAVFDLQSNSSLFAVPYPKPEQLFLIGFKDKQNDSNSWREGRYLRLYEEQTSAFSEFAAASWNPSNVVVDGDPRFESVRRTTKDFFNTLGIKPAFGRTFAPEEYFAGADNVVVISDLFWRQRFKGASNVLGKSLRIDGQICTVVGVLPVLQPLPSVLGGTVYRPYVPTNNPGDVFNGSVAIVGRLRPGVTTEEATRQLASVKEDPPVPQWAAQYLAEQVPLLIPIRQLDHPDSGWIMVGAAVLLYMIACSNAMNLVLLRVLGRRHEFSIRLAMGANRGAVIRLLAIENAGICAASCLIVVFGAIFVFPAAFSSLSLDDDAKFAVYTTGRSMLCILLLSAVAGLSIFIASASAFARSRTVSLKDAGARASEGRGAIRLKNGLIVIQIALAVVLLFGTGLMVRTFQKLHNVDLGFDPSGKVKVQIGFPETYEKKPETRLHLFETLSDRLGFLPGVRDVAAGQDSLVIGFYSGTAQLQMQDGTFQPVAGNFVSKGFQKAAGLRLKRGRWLLADKKVDEAVINETMARARFGNVDPIGQSFKIQVALQYPMVVVGVIQDVRQGAKSGDGMRFYVPDWIFPLNLNTLVIRLDHDPKDGFADMVRRTVYNVDPMLITTVESIHEAINEPLESEIYVYKVLRYLTVVGFGLVIVGIFSVIAYTVDCGMKEFGIRRAIGADSFRLRRLVLWRGLAPTIGGIVVGVAAGLGLTRFMKSLLFETTPNDPVVCLTVVIVLLVASTAACWFPASRAAKVDITKLLKTD